MRSLSIKEACLASSWWFFFLFAIANGPAFGADSPVESKVDLRVLIDVSGSMKRTDPENLRSSALRLLVGLLPETATAGVWTFGKFVNMSVPLGGVNSAWRDKARIEANNIHSFGLFTNIEEALQLSTFDWNKPDPNVQRSIILLSDGMVDVSKNEVVNKQSRDRIINTILPRLGHSNVTIHTVALSSEADHELLELIAVSTDGWYEKVEDANKLQRAFLRLFEKSSPTDTLPIEDNIFEVDKSIEDMTLLVFRDKKSKATRILMPGGKSLSKDEHPKHIKWHHENGFDLITINAPEAGAWRIDSKIDPDNRVMVVTNLKLSANKLPNHLLKGEELFLSAKLLQDNAPINEKKLLKYVDFNYNHSKPANNASSVPVLEPLLDNGKNPDEKAGDGIYNAELTLLKEGKHQLSVISEGPTFKREAFFIVNVHANLLKAEIAQVDVSKEEVFRVSLIGKPKLKGLEIHSFAVKLKGMEISSEIQKVNEDLWMFYLPRKFSGEDVTIEFFAQLKERNKILFKLEETVPEYVKKSSDHAIEDLDDIAESKKEEAIGKEDNNNEVAVDHEKEIKELSDSLEKEESVEEADPANDIVAKNINSKKETEKVTEKEKGLHWILIVSIAMVVNALLGLIGVGAYFLWKKRRNKLIPVEEAEITYA